MPDRDARCAENSLEGAVEWRIWSSRVPLCADTPELEPNLPENAMRLGRVEAVDFWREKVSVRFERLFREQGE